MSKGCEQPGLMPFHQAKNELIEAVPSIAETEQIAITEADGRVLAADIVSPLNVPGHNNSAMDGYALCDLNLAAESAPLTEFTLVGSALAGVPFESSLKQGQCIRITTGAVVPEGANSVVMQENVKQIESEVGKTVTLTTPTSLHNNIRFAGEDIAQGQQVFAAGHQLSAIDIGLLSSLGLEQVTVLRKLKVAVMSTGDELKLPGQALEAGQIYESNSQLLVAMLKRLKVEVINLGIIPDSKTAIESALTKANAEADVIISSGGVSVGHADYIKEVLAQLGQINFWKVAIKPGKPFAFGQLSDSVFFGLPGNPVSAAVTFHQLAMPALVKMSGTEAKPTPRMLAINLAKIKKRPGRMDFQRGIAEVNAEGQLTVTPLGAQGSGILSSIAKANCYIVLEQEQGGVEAGEQVQIELFDKIIG